MYVYKDIFDLFCYLCQDFLRDINKRPTTGKHKGLPLDKVQKIRDC